MAQGYGLGRVRARVRISWSFSSFCHSSPRGKGRIYDELEPVKYSCLPWFSHHSIETTGPRHETIFKAGLKDHHCSVLSLILMDLANVLYESIWENHLCSHEDRRKIASLYIQLTRQCFFIQRTYLVARVLLFPCSTYIWANKAILWPKCSQ